MHADKRRLKKQAFWIYPRLSALICGSKSSRLASRSLRLRGYFFNPWQALQILTYHYR
jgi:hypothetical protein